MEKLGTVILSFEEFFTVKDIRKRLREISEGATEWDSLEVSPRTVQEALRKFTNNEDLIRVREGRNSVWITKEAAEKKGFVTKEDIERAFRNSDLFLELQSQVERLGTVILSFEEFFTVEGVQKRLKEVSEGATEWDSLEVSPRTVQEVLRKFTNNRDLIRVREGRNSVWITKEAAQKKGLVTKEDIERAFRNSDLFLELQSQVDRVETVVLSFEEFFTVKDIRKRLREASEDTTGEDSQKVSSNAIRETLKKI